MLEKFKEGQKILYRGAEGAVESVIDVHTDSGVVSYLTISLNDYELVSIIINNDTKPSVISPALRKISSMDDDELRKFCKLIFNRNQIYKPRMRWINGKLKFFAELGGIDRFSCNCMDEIVGKVGMHWLKEHNFDIVNKYNY